MPWKKFAVLGSSVFLGVAVWTALLVALSNPQTAFADPVQLFVTPGGSGMDCSQAAPCALGTAMGQAVDGDSVYLASGTYIGGGHAVITVTESITLFGGWDGTTTFPPVRDPAAYPTTLDGESERQVVYISSWLTPTLDGLIISGGNATAAWDPGRGGGIYSIGSSPVIRNNILRDNVASTNGRGVGGGIYIHSGAQARLIDNIIINNTASITGGTGDGGGVALVWHPGAVVAGNQVAHNIAQGGTAPYYGSDGGGIYCSHSDDLTLHANLIQHNIASVVANGSGGGIGFHICDRVTITGNTLVGNIGADLTTGITGYGGGLSAYASEGLTIEANWILSNTAHLGGGFYLSRNTAFTMTNNLIARNLATEKGGGLAFETSEIEPVSGALVHNSFVANDRGIGDGRIAIHMNNWYVTLVLTNNLIYSHTYGLYAHDVCTATLYNTLFYANNAADVGPFGNITNLDPITGLNPLLNTEYHLLPGSPAIDAGAIVPWVTTDIDGDLRPFHNGYDIGADESSIMPEFKTYLPLIHR